ncbi:MAG TPA: GNAT family N-acetyltransferase [Ferruginibacter sp.]|nr:GNAT family N-acetyltransferase [Ferruginibacter sp.]
MESEYVIKKATLNDVDFIADVIIGAEKSLTDNLGLANFFELSEEEVKKLIIAMLEEEVDGCDFSISSFFIAWYGDKPVGALGGWVEGYYDGMSSNLLKSNLIAYVFPKESLVKAQAKMEMIKEMLHIERPMGTYQLEYVYVDNDHRGKRITQQLMDVHLAYAKQLDPNACRAQLSCFENNESIIKAHERNGYVRMKRYVCDNEEILNYLPFNVKVLLEKQF